MSARRGSSAAWVGLASLIVVAGCAPPPFVPGQSTAVEEPDPGEVEAVLFLVGDAGNAPKEESPLLHHLRAEVERWSERLPGDSSVAVVFLGDNIYPVGLRDRDHEDFAEDSVRLHAQIWTVSGPEALADGVPGVFLAGNHDWGSLGGREGLPRLRNQERHLRERAADGGPAVSLVPPAGDPGPGVLELGDQARVLLLDTEWWLQTREPAERSGVLADLQRVLGGEGDVPVLMAAHHPYASGGAHARRSLLDPVGLLARSGAIIQDMNSGPYQAFLEGLDEIFRQTGPPLVYAGGHDHSLQVIEGQAPGAPEWALVSGSASKLSGVSEVPGMVWAESAPGYMRLVFQAGGRVDLFVERAPGEYLRCEGETSERSRCLQEGIDAFSTGYSARLR